MPDPTFTLHGWWSVLEMAWSAAGDNGTRLALLRLLNRSNRPNSPNPDGTDLLQAVQALTSRMPHVLMQLHALLSRFNNLRRRRWAAELNDVFAALVAWDGPSTVPVTVAGLRDLRDALERRAWVIVAGRELFGGIKNRPRLGLGPDASFPPLLGLVVMMMPPKSSPHVNAQAYDSSPDQDDRRPSTPPTLPTIIITPPSPSTSPLSPGNTSGIVGLGLIGIDCTVTSRQGSKQDKRERQAETLAVPLRLYTKKKPLAQALANLSDTPMQPQVASQTMQRHHSFKSTRTFVSSVPMQRSAPLPSTPMQRSVPLLRWP